MDVEGAVAEEALATLAGGRPKLLSFGVADETAWEVGLACGGTIQIFVEAVDDEIFPAVDRLLHAEVAGATASVIAGPEALLGRKLPVDAQGGRAGHIDPALDDRFAAVMGWFIAHGASQRVALTEPALELFVDVLLPPPTLMMIGGVHIVVALSSSCQDVRLSHDSDRSAHGFWQ